MTGDSTPAAVNAVALALVTAERAENELPPCRFDTLTDYGQKLYRERAQAAVAAMPPAIGEQWRPIAEAPRDGTWILAAYWQPGDGRYWNGRIFQVRHEGVTIGGYDMGWSLFPGHGGVPDDWFAGWMPSPTPPESVEP